MEGGSRLNFPVMEKCGSLSFGSSQWKFIMPLIFSMAPETIFLAPSQTVENAFLIPFRILVTVLFAAVSPVEIPFLIAVIVPVTTDLMPFQTVDVTDLMAFQALVTTVFTAPTVVEKIFLIPFHTVWKNVLIALKMV